MSPCGTLIAAATAVLSPMLLTGDVAGNVTFIEWSNGVYVRGSISGLAPGDHGLHVHSLGVASDFNCTNSGSHYDPFKKAHGDVSAEIRHAGDLGNIVAGDDGVAPVDIWVPASEGLALKLSGDANIAGRALVIHGGADDKGLNTSNPESAKNGASGPRVGCGNIVYIDATLASDSLL